MSAAMPASCPTITTTWCGRRRTAGAGRELAESRARSRLGNEDDLAEAMLSQPELRSLMSRFPWAVFGLGPIALLAVGVVAALFIEIWLLELTTGIVRAMGRGRHRPPPAGSATLVFTAYNTLAVYGAPLLFAWLFYWLGSRQRMSGGLDRYRRCDCLRPGRLPESGLLRHGLPGYGHLMMFRRRLYSALPACRRKVWPVPRSISPSLAASGGWRRAAKPRLPWRFHTAQI